MEEQIYLIYDKTLGIKHSCTIDQAINLIKQNPNNQFYKYIDGNEVLINNSIACNTLFIAHRINTKDELGKIPEIFGVELDLRDDYINDQIIITHDPFTTGESFEEYLQFYKHKTIILNVKSERIEPRCLELLEQYNITDYFFLDSSFPMIHLLNAKYNEQNIACRFSEYEPIENYLNNSKLTKWVWVDCFSTFPLSEQIYLKINLSNGKICIVSPELQGQIEKIDEYRKILCEKNIIPDAICCKIYNIIKWI